MEIRPLENEYASFFARYVQLVPEGGIVDILKRQTDETKALLESLTEEQGDFRYAEGKWSLKEVIGHICDNERIMSCRLLRIARGDRTELPGYDQDVLTAGAPFRHWSVRDLIRDYSAVRESTITMLELLQEEAWTRRGIVSGHEVTPRAWAYIMTGHERHHLKVIQERYLNEK